jgi:hypothetical protein
MADVYRATVGGGAAATETVGLAIIPPPGEGLKLSNLHFQNNFAGGITFSRLQVQESIDTGATFPTVIYEDELLAAGQVFLDSQRFLLKSPTNLVQANNSTALQYRVQVISSAVASRYTASVAGRTE